MQSAWARLRGKPDPNLSFDQAQRTSKDRHNFWALRDITFEVPEGQVVGIIGRNGAGKSTLLKILSRITRPTQGQIKVKGRIASLLEVGTGFHPELTGRENIFLNGAILGMSRSEIRSNLDKIVDFAGIETFIDTPVKRYSSGMYVRLGFAVAAHLESEILIVDEVLAVGDMEFQKKCIGKMSEVATDGRTVLFVSHNMAAIQNLCTRAILLDNGELIGDGETQKILFQYNGLTRERLSSRDFSLRTDRSGNGQLRFLSYSLVNPKGEVLSLVRSGEHITIRINLELRQPVPLITISIGIDDAMGQRILLLSNDIVAGPFKNLSAGKHQVNFKIMKLPLMPGQFTFTLFAASSGVVLDWLQNAGSIDVEDGDYYSTGRLPPNSQGTFLVEYETSIEQL
jgi:lipopolysaccharide transport system ATP-binding protein